MGVPSLRAIDDGLIQRVKRRIVAACDPAAILLFGSAAHGETRSGSDVDLLVVMDLPDGVRPHDQARELYRLFRGELIPLDITVRTPEHFRRARRLPGFVSNVAAEEGIRIYG